VQIAKINVLVIYNILSQLGYKLNLLGNTYKIPTFY